MAVRRIVYFSRSLTGPSDAEISDLLKISRRNNSRDGVTGLLLHLQGVYAQVLEGQTEKIDATLSRIQADPRHTQFTILTDETVENPVFTDWSMAFVDTDVSKLLSIAGLEGVEDAMRAFENSSQNASPPVLDKALHGLSRYLDDTPATQP
jgi:hypothetical protein